MIISTPKNDARPGCCWSNCMQERKRRVTGVSRGRIRAYTLVIEGIVQYGMGLDLIVCEQSVLIPVKYRARLL